MKFSHHLLRLVLLTSVFSILTVRPLPAQSSSFEISRALVSTGKPASPPAIHRPRTIPEDAVAAIDLGNDQRVTAYCHKGSFDRVGLRHDQMVDIAVQYSTDKAGHVIAVEPLDGGHVVAAAKNLTVGADGTIRFKFQAGRQPGVYQIVLRDGPEELGLQFWVLDDEHPKNNPPVVNSGN